VREEKNDRNNITCAIIRHNLSIINGYVPHQKWSRLPQNIDRFAKKRAPVSQAEEDERKIHHQLGLVGHFFSPVNTKILLYII